MVALNKLNKNEFGKILLPKKIYNFKYKYELETLYEKLYFDNINYLVIFNLFFGSILFSFLVYVLLYTQIFILFNDYIISSSFYNFLFITFTWFVISLISYYLFFFRRGL